MTALHFFSLVWGVVQIVGIIAIPFAVVAERGKKDERFEGERLWYRS